MDLPFSINEPKALILLLSIPPVVALGILSARARPRDRGRVNASTALRCAILVLITLALAGLQWVTSGGPLNVVFLIDESASVSPEARQASIEYVQKAISAMGPDDRAGVVLFGENAVVDRALSAGAEWKPFGEHPSTLATNIADAIQAGGALFPEGGSRRLVLLSDGVETTGKATELARAMALTGVQLSVVPLGVQSANEVAIDQVISPASVPAGQQHDVRVLVKSTSDRTVTVSLFDGDDPVGKQDAQLKVGDNVITFSIKAKGEGFHVLRASLDAVDDRYAENNSASSFTIVRKPPTVLIVASSPADSEPLKEALGASGVDSMVVAPAFMPHTAEGLDKYDAVIISNASAEAVGLEGQQALQSYVRDRGRGLIMLGGDLGYGAGGYLGSPIEEVLPVKMDVRTSEERASLAMTFVIDKSGSMGRCHCGGATRFDPSMRTEFGESKLEIVKQAISKSAALLKPSDQVGVVGFDAQSHWLVNLQSLGNIGEVGLAQSLKLVQAEGETNMFEGLQAPIAQLGASDAQIKQIILLSDGWSQQASFSPILDQLKAAGISLSTVAVGEGPGELLKQLADLGGGEYYRAEDVKTIPDVILKETVRLIGAYYIEEPFRPLLNRSSPILQGVDTANLPRLLGYNGATIKPSAELVLKSPRDDPLLAQWQYGLGRSVAWTSDAKGRWATDWIKWPQFPQFAGQMVNWAMPKEVSPGLAATFVPEAGSSPAAQDVSVRIESVDAVGAPRNFLSTTLVVTTTGNIRQEVPISQSSPGVYTGRVKGLRQGVYEAAIDQRDSQTGEHVASQRTGIVIPYPSEYRLSEDAVNQASALMGDLAQLGGGKELNMAEPAAVWSRDITAQPRRIPMWPWLLGLAMLLFPLDVAVRRLTLSRTELRQLLERRGSQE